MDGKLNRQYEGIEKDIEQLIDEGYIRVLEASPTKKQKQERERGNTAFIKYRKVLFPKSIPMDNNPSNAVEYTSTELPENCNKFLANLWDDKVDKFQDL